MATQAQLGEGTAVEIRPEFGWVTVVTTDKKPYFYPTRRAELSKKRYSLSAVYRWALCRDGGKPQFLVGETDDLYRRVNEYLTHKGKHHKSIREVFDKHRARGGTVALETLQFEPFVINAVHFFQERLADPFVRRVLENLCCAQLMQESFELLNSTLDRKIVRLLEKLEPEVLRKLLEPFRQGTASAVPNSEQKEGGFSR